MSLPHLDRLTKIRDLLTRTHRDASNAMLACYSAKGFTTGLRDAAPSSNVVLVDLPTSTPSCDTCG